MLGLAIQVGGNAHSSDAGLLAPLLFVLGGVAVAGFLLPLVRIVVERVRAGLRGRRMRRRRVVAAAAAERRARAMMGELCPHGWRAHVTLLDGSPTSGPAHAAVALDWYELRPDGGEPTVMRRVWAPTIADALEAMVIDRRTDETLEQIELQASADGALWPDR